jgi:hypothetical protein
MSGVICLYYPVAGLTDTMGGCGIQVAPGTEVDALINIVKHGETEQTKQREQGRAYAEGCTWPHRAQQWVQTLTLNPSNTLQTPGPPGPKGAQGDLGSTGASGATGPQGATGQSGQSVSNSAH